MKPYIIGIIVGDYVRLGQYQELFDGAILVIIILIFEAIGQFSLSYIANDLGQRVIKIIRDELFAHISKFQLKYFDNNPIGMLVSRVISDIETISEVFSQGILLIVGDILKLAGVIFAMFFINWQLTLIILIPIPILIIATTIFKKAIKKSFFQVRRQIGILNSFVQEHITGMSVVQIFSREEQEAINFKKINNEHKEAHIKGIMAYSIFFPVVELLSALSVALLILYSINQFSIYKDIGKTTAELTSFILYIHMLFRPIRMLADRFNTLQMGMLGASRVFTVLDTKSSIMQNDNKILNAINGNIEFKNVIFEYKKDNIILNNISFKVKSGETLAFVGETGAGKTSIINLLARYYEFQSGEILLDDVNIKDINIENLRKHISVVLQDVFLYSDTIMNNITLGNKNISEADVILASKKIGTHNFISRLPGAYNFNVKERGSVLSTGQRQLISFIRSYVYNPEILILDEATSSIDSQTEELIQKAIEKLTENRTSIIIAHRLSTIKKANRIILLEKGKIIESGTHTELINKKNSYYRLYNNQNNL